MTGQHVQPKQRESSAPGLGRAGLHALALLACAATAGLTSTAAAQQGWAPTVATAPGGTLNAPMPGHAPLPGAVNRAPTKIDPRYFPSPRSTVAPARHPHGAWSPIVTGALPLADVRAPMQGTDSREAGVAPTDGPTPVRRTAGQMAAAGDGKDGGDKVGLDAAGADSPPLSGGDGADGPFKKPGPLDALPPNASAAEQYCFNTADSAADARFAWQAKKIQDMEAALDKKAQQLAAMTEDYKRWLARRDEFSRKAHEKLVAFYSRMRPDAAAVQLATLDEEMAAAVVMKLETKVASQVMGEMDPEQAAKIATVISGAGKLPADKRGAAGAASARAPEGPSEVPDATPPPEDPRS
jgi:flagellar motility protein MotE (MotC chaperone)